MCRFTTSSAPSKLFTAWPAASGSQDGSRCAALNTSFVIPGGRVLPGTTLTKAQSLQLWQLSQVPTGQGLPGVAVDSQAFQPLQACQGSQVMPRQQRGTFLVHASFDKAQAQVLQACELVQVGHFRAAGGKLVDLTAEDSKHPLHLHRTAVSAL